MHYGIPRVKKNTITKKPLLREDLKIEWKLFQIFQSIYFVSGPYFSFFCVCKELSKNSGGGYVCTSKTIKNRPNQLPDPLRFLFSEDSLKIKKGLELVSRPYFS